MQIQWQLHPHGPWYISHEPLIYDEGLGKYIYFSQATHNEEERYLAAKLAVSNLIAEAVDEQLQDLAKGYRDEIIDAICYAWVTKVNLAIMADGTIATSLKIPLNSGGLEVREDGEIHYWTATHEDLGNIRNLLKAQLKIILQKIYNAVSSISDMARAVKFARLMLVDICNQFVIEIIP